MLTVLHVLTKNIIRANLLNSPEFVDSGFISVLGHTVFYNIE